jgi:hypothetical protein
VALGHVFSENFGFPCQSAFHLLLHNHLHYHPRLAQWARSGRSANSLTNQKKRSIKIGALFILPSCVSVSLTRSNQVLFCVMCVVCVLCLIVVPLIPGENPFAVKIYRLYVYRFPTLTSFYTGYYPKRRVVKYSWPCL